MIIPARGTTSIMRRLSSVLRTRAKYEDVNSESVPTPADIAVLSRRVMQLAEAGHADALKAALAAAPAGVVLCANFDSVGNSDSDPTLISVFAHVRASCSPQTSSASRAWVRLPPAAPGRPRLRLPHASDMRAVPSSLAPAPSQALPHSCSDSCSSAGVGWLRSSSFS